MWCICTRTCVCVRVRLLGVLIMDGCWEGKQTRSWDPAVRATFHRNEPPGGTGRRLNGLSPPTTLCSTINASYCLLVAVLLEMNPKFFLPHLTSMAHRFWRWVLWVSGMSMEFARYLPVKSLKRLDNIASKLNKVNPFHYSPSLLSPIICYSSQRFRENRFFFN